MDALTIVTECWVPGDPKTKGSMEHVGSGNMRQSVAGSERYAALVAQCVKEDRTRRGLTEPSRGPVGLRAVFWVRPPRRLVSEYDQPPTWERAGDYDKYLRNVGDALKKAGAYVDDVQVTHLIEPCLKIACLPHETPGTLIQCWQIPVWQISRYAGEARALRERVRGEEGAWRWARA